jgi:polyisoprenoid-binding protein YceI
MSEGMGARMATQQAIAHYQIDPALSRFTIRAFATGLLSAFGHDPTIAARQYEGEAGFVPGTLDQAYLRMRLQPDSFEVVDDVSEKDKHDIETKMKLEVLETSRFPEIVFESTSVQPTRMGDANYSVKITGNLTLHGATRNLTIYCQLSLNGETLHSAGEFSVRQTDFGIKPPTVAGGAMKVKDELKCSFDITARKQGT